MSIMDTLTIDFDAYLLSCIKGLEIKVDYYDQTALETHAKLLCMNKTDATHDTEAWIILVQRLMLINYGWLGADRSAPGLELGKRYVYSSRPSEYSKLEIEDFARWSEWLKTEYSKSTYTHAVSIETDPDRFGLFPANREDTIRLNRKQISFHEYDTTSPLLNERIIKASKSTFSWSVEFYLDTLNHYVLSNWCTTA